MILSTSSNYCILRGYTGDYAKMKEDEVESILNSCKCLGKLVVLHGRPCSGKTSLMNKIIELYNNKFELPNVHHTPDKPVPRLRIRKAKKHTTRNPRPDDDPDEFVYLSKAQFMELAKEGLIEVTYTPVTNVDNLYGWSSTDLKPEDHEIVLTPSNDSDVARDLKYLCSATNLFVEAPKDILRDRLRARGGPSDVVQRRIGLLDTNYPIVVYDNSMQQHTVTLEDHFYGTYDSLEGLSPLIIQNVGDLNHIVERLFSEILRIVSLKENPFYQLPIKKLEFSKDDDSTFFDTIEIREEGYVTAVGNPVTHRPRFNKGSRDFESLIMLGVAKRLYWGKRSNYFVQISDFRENVDLDSVRPKMFGGYVVRPIEYLASKNPIELNLSEILLRNGFTYVRPHSPGDGEPLDVEINATYLEGRTPYRNIRKIFEGIELNRII